MRVVLLGAEFATPANVTRNDEYTEAVQLERPVPDPQA
jgi:hypothetical protein